MTLYFIWDIMSSIKKNKYGLTTYIKYDIIPHINKRKENMQPNSLGKQLEEMNKLVSSTMNYSKAQCLKNCALDIIQIMKDELTLEGKSDKSNRKMFVNICHKVMDLAQSYQEEAKKLEKLK